MGTSRSSTVIQRNRSLRPVAPVPVQISTIECDPDGRDVVTIAIVEHPADSG